MTRLHFSARAAAVVALLTAVLPPPASARSTAAAPTRVWAAINTVHSSAIDVTDTSGNKTTVTLPVDISVTQIAPIEPSATQTGSYTGTTTVKGPDDTLRMLEVHVFPEAMRGTEDGHRPCDLGPNDSVTNGTVEQAGAVAGAQGRTLSVKCKGREQRIVVPPQAPIVTFEPGRRNGLEADTHVVMFVRADAQDILVM